MQHCETQTISNGFSHWKTSRSLFLLLGVLLQITSCVPVEQMIYLQGQEPENSGDSYTYDKREYYLQVNDILDIKISSLNPEINALFNTSNFGSLQMAQASTQSGGDLYYMSGYSISKDGEVDIPFVGPVKVDGLTLNEAHAVIDRTVQQYFSNYHLQVKLGGVRFSALGEFNRPGKQVIMQNQVTIFEAIALCGDLTSVADRKNVRLVRQYPDGTKIHSLNLLDQTIINSPYYFVQPNDVLYAEPLPQKAWGFGVTGSQSLSTIIGSLSTSTALILSIITLTSN